MLKNKEDWFFFAAQLAPKSFWSNTVSCDVKKLISIPLMLNLPTKIMDLLLSSKFLKE